MSVLHSRRKGGDNGVENIYILKNFRVDVWIHRAGKEDWEKHKMLLTNCKLRDIGRNLQLSVQDIRVSENGRRYLSQDLLRMDSTVYQNMRIGQDMNTLHLFVNDSVVE